MAAAAAAPSPPRSATAPLSETDPDPSPPSPAPETHSQPPPPAPASVNPRRPPPPCWSPDETVALIDIYREKWHSLGRAALKLKHWEEVADAVASRCPLSTPPKTATQCRHKMEKLRKRYRAEIRRGESLPVARFNSSWVHFKRMEAMDRSRSRSHDDDDDDGGENDDEDDDIDADLYEQPLKRKKTGPDPRSSGRHMYYPNGIGAESATRGKFQERVRIKIPTTGRQEFKTGSYVNSSGVDTGPKRGLPPSAGKRQRQSSDPLQEVVSAVKVFREGFERMERMKIDMAKEISAMQLEMETKRTEMILESQQFIAKTLAKLISEKTKSKTKNDNNNSKKKTIKSEEALERIPTPEAEV